MKKGLEKFLIGLSGFFVFWLILLGIKIQENNKKIQSLEADLTASDTNQTNLPEELKTAELPISFETNPERSIGIGATIPINIGETNPANTGIGKTQPVVSVPTNKPANKKTRTS